ncbi:MAG: T9SS type A sorting domain-containing protein [Bacteroidales bacterium]|nr:T9SS type A sorting domain-containing protein [Bacteroidales bacterium]
MKSRKVLLGLIVGFCVCLAGSATAQKANYQSNKLVEIGPDNIGGRVTSLVVASHPDQNTSLVYAGAATGGLYTRLVSLEAGVDTIWDYVPCYINGEELTLPISSMLKVNDSIIVIATGESYYGKGNKLNKLAALGRGVFLFNMNTNEFTLLEATNPGTDLDADFAAVNDMAMMNSQGITYVFIATPKGLFRWTIAQNNDWNATPTRIFDGDVRCVIVSKQFNRAFFSSKGSLDKISDVINNSDVVDITGSCSGFGANTSYIDLAMAPSDESYLYAMACDKNGLMKGLYLTRNTNTWLLLSSSTVTPFTSAVTAKTCGAITVSPNDPTKVFLGGANVWVGKGYVENSPFQWTVSSSNESQLNSGDYMAAVYSSRVFVHSGIHQIVPDTRWREETSSMFEGYYIVTDGGVYYSPSSSLSYFENFNRGMNNVQINSLAVCPDGSIISGANANACPFIEARVEHNGGDHSTSWYDREGSLTNHMANVIWKGNGGTVAASRFTQYSPLSRRTIFVSAANGSIGRAYADFSDYTNTQTWTSDEALMTDLVAGGPAIGQFYLWETDNNVYANDSMTITIDTLSFIKRNGQRIDITTNLQVKSGDSILLLDPAHASYPFWHVFDHNFVVKNEMRQRVHSPYISRMAAVTVENDMPQNTNVSYCWFPTDFRKVFDASNETRFWSHIYGVNGATTPHLYVRYTAISNNGDCVFVVVENDTLNQSYLVRVRGFNRANYNASVAEIRDMLNYKIRTRITTTDTLMVSDGSYYFGRRISSITVDQREGMDRVVLTFDGYGNNYPNLAYIENASSDNPRITYPPQTTLAPAYSAMIEYTTGAVYLGTEEGVFRSASVTSGLWEPYGAFKGVPVTSMYQVTNNYSRIKFIGHDGVTEVPYVFPRTKYAYAMYFGTYGRGIFMDSTYVIDHTNEIVDPEDYAEDLDIPSIANVGANAVRFYPNPAVDNATMELTVNKPGNAIVRIYDLTGKVVYTENMGRVAEGVITRTIDCSNLLHGMYLVNVVIGGEKATSKLIVR